MSLLYLTHTSGFPSSTNKGATATDIVDIAAIFNSINSIEDSQSAILAAQLALEDIQDSLAAALCRNAPEDELTVLEMQCESLHEWLCVAKTTSLPQVFGSEASEGADYLNSIRIAEEAALQDRRAAQMLERGEELPEITEAQRILGEVRNVSHPDPSNKDHQVINDLFGTENGAILEDTENSVRGKMKSSPTEEVPLYSATTSFNASVIEDLQVLEVIFGEMKNEVMDSHAESSVTGKKMVVCTICAEELRFDKALHTVCDHYYCPDCITSFVECAMHDEEVYPIRCCLYPIDVASIREFIPHDMRQPFSSKIVEYEVPTQHRIYCANQKCGSFIGSSENVDKHGIACHLCNSSTCSGCKQAFHMGECVDTAAERLRELAAEKKWQTCPGCKWLVERTEGCPHLTCRCKFEFCYICGGKWPACRCST